MPKWPDAPGAQMPRSPDAQTPRCPDAQMPRRPDAQMPMWNPSLGKAQKIQNQNSPNHKKSVTLLTKKIHYQKNFLASVQEPANFLPKKMRNKFIWADNTFSCKIFFADKWMIQLFSEFLEQKVGWISFWVVWVIMWASGHLGIWASEHLIVWASEHLGNWTSQHPITWSKISSPDHLMIPKSNCSKFSKNYQKNKPRYLVVKKTLPSKKNI